MEHTKHIWRVVLLLGLLCSAVVVVRHFLIPESFGEHGFFRYASLAEFMAKPIVHGAPDSCRPCHEEQAKAKGEGAHAPVSCEVCHGPLMLHAQGGEKIADMPIDRSQRLCATCHTVLPARPADMPQVDFWEHLELGRGEPIPDRVCGLCHESHAPAAE